MQRAAAVPSATGSMHGGGRGGGGAGFLRAVASTALGAQNQASLLGRRAAVVAVHAGGAGGNTGRVAFRRRKPRPDPLQKLVLRKLRNIQNDVRGIQNDVRGIQNDVRGIQNDVRGIQQKQDGFAETQGIIVESLVGSELRERDPPDVDSSKARRAVKLQSADSVVACVLPQGLPPRLLHEDAPAQLTAWLIEDRGRGIRAILRSCLRAVPSLLGGVAGSAEDKAAAATEAEVALTELEKAGAGQKELRAACDALKCCAARLPVSLKLLEDCVKDPKKAEELLRGELCIAALTSLHPVSGTASSTAKELEIDRLLPLRLLPAADGANGTSNNGGIALLEVQEFKSSTAGLPTGRDQAARLGSVLGCSYGVLQERLQHAAAGAVPPLPAKLRLQGTIALGKDGDPNADAAQLPPQQTLKTADDKVHDMQMQYLVLAKGALVPWVPSRPKQ
ncbi:hypothetical protein HYH02_011469 [Chlamydomonas schloesseri]|uniref:Uncharacterized protein n=1 Tax=Chlamydomonas schloesseri TaxID=2026947 RepID=A0A835T377_9CHLO|nr:hypothetical protein HYH02_011469 [Chlamydomonas schloesseri]|eukprot:KAG2436531.1 hypothetical protein HYH02_011469 [Chlamydomonas schloesseri]